MFEVKCFTVTKNLQNSLETEAEILGQCQGPDKARRADENL